MTITTEEAERLAALAEDWDRYELGKKAPEIEWNWERAPVVIRSLAAERDALKAESEVMEAALRRLNSSITPQKEIALQAENARLREALRPFIQTGNVQVGYRVKLDGQEPPPITASEEEAWAHYGGSDFYYQQWLQWRAVQIGRELLGETQ